ncbi:MAG: hypothetical protein ABW076_00815 [Candidatus Thiodiazotropha sp.]
MNNTEEIEMHKMDRELLDDVDHLLKRYVRIFEWDIPDSNESDVRKIILQRMHKALDRLESQE